MDRKPVIGAYKTHLNEIFTLEAGDLCSICRPGRDIFAREWVFVFITRFLSSSTDMTAGFPCINQKQKFNVCTHLNSNPLDSRKLITKCSNSSSTEMHLSTQLQRILEKRDLISGQHFTVYSALMYFDDCHPITQLSLKTSSRGCYMLSLAFTFSGNDRKLSIRTVLKEPSDVQPNNFLDTLVPDILNGTCEGFQFCKELGVKCRVFLEFCGLVATVL